MEQQLQRERPLLAPAVAAANGATASGAVGNVNVKSQILVHEYSWAAKQLVHCPAHNLTVTEQVATGETNHCKHAPKLLANSQRAQTTTEAVAGLIYVK